MNHIQAITRRIATFALVFFAGAAFAQNNVLVILDASNSMWGQIDGQPKIEIAREVLSDLLSELPSDSRVGLMAYGHRREGDCSDVEMIGSAQGEAADNLLARIRDIQPRGKTPIAASLAASMKPLEGSSSNHVVLISDGVETCGGDPCAQARAMIDAGIDVRVHVVGFDVSAEDRRQLECIAEAGQGRYFDAQSAEGLRLAVNEVREETQADPPSASEPWFRDDFDGDSLSGDWEVLNENPDAYIVEDGALLFLASKASNLEEEDSVQNLVRLKQAMPDANWTATARFAVDFKTKKEMPFVGLYEDQDNFLIAALPLFQQWPNYPITLTLTGIKRSGGQSSVFEEQIAEHRAHTPLETVLAEVPQAVLLRLAKKGREFTVSAKWDGVEDAEWMVLDSFTLLRAKGNLTLGFFQRMAVPGESVANVDWVTVETD